MKYSVNFLDYLIYGLIFARIGAFLFFVPVFSQNAISSRIKVYFAFWTMMVMAPVLSQSFPKGIDSPSLLSIMVVHEIMIGACLGLVLNFMFLILEFAGSLISQAIGLTNVSFHSPNMGGQISLPSNLLMIAGTLLLITTDMHHYLIRIFYQSYSLIPAGSFEFHDMGLMLLKTSKNIISLGLKLATPVIIFGLLISISLGILNRLIPQVQIFMLSQPLQIGFGFFVFLFAIKELMLTFLKDYHQFLSEF